jgi:hypothetical protein
MLNEWVTPSMVFVVEFYSVCSYVTTYIYKLFKKPQRESEDYVDVVMIAFTLIVIVMLNVEYIVYHDKFWLYSTNFVALVFIWNTYIIYLISFKNYDDIMYPLLSARVRSHNRRPISMDVDEEDVELTSTSELVLSADI